MNDSQCFKYLHIASQNFVAQQSTFTTNRFLLMTKENRINQPCTGECCQMKEVCQKQGVKPSKRFSVKKGKLKESTIPIRPTKRLIRASSFSHSRSRSRSRSNQLNGKGNRSKLHSIQIPEEQCNVEEDEDDKPLAFNMGLFSQGNNPTQSDPHLNLKKF